MMIDTPETKNTYVLPDVTRVEVIDGNGIVHRSIDAGSVEVDLDHNGITLRVTHTGATERIFKGRP